MKIKLSRLLVPVLCLGAFAFTPSDASAQSRAKKRIGVGMGFVGDPVPSVTSYQFKFNINKFLQVNANYGKVGSLVTSYSGGVRAFLIPAWNFSPYVGANYGIAKVDGSFDLGSNSVDIPEESVSTIVLGAGLDHQSNLGFSFGAGINYVLKPTELADAFQIIPNFHIAWFF